MADFRFTTLHCNTTFLPTPRTRQTAKTPALRQSFQPAAVDDTLLANRQTWHRIQPRGHSDCSFNLFKDEQYHVAYPNITA